jgi:putative transposase
MEAMISFVDAYRDDHGIEPICRVLAIAPSTYHAHVARRAAPEMAPARVRRDAELCVVIRRVFDENFQVYGVRKVWRQMLREGHDVARCTVARLMKKMALQGVIRGRRVRTTVSDRAAPCPLDHVNRRFKAPRPNVLWVSDFTYVTTWTGFVYVAFVIDAYARRIIGWRVSRSAHAGFVLDALEQALHDRKPVSGAGLVHHSDRGASRRGRARAIGRQRRRQLRQRTRRDDQRALQSRGDPSVRALALAGSRRVRHARMGRLV